MAVKNEKEYRRDYARQYRAKYPDREKQYRIAYAKHLLEKAGYKVSKDPEPKDVEE